MNLPIELNNDSEFAEFITLWQNYSHDSHLELLMNVVQKLDNDLFYGVDMTLNLGGPEEMQWSWGVFLQQVGSCC